MLVGHKEFEKTPAATTGVWSFTDDDIENITGCAIPDNTRSIDLSIIVDDQTFATDVGYLIFYNDSARTTEVGRIAIPSFTRYHALIPVLSKFCASSSVIYTDDAAVSSGDKTVYIRMNFYDESRVRIFWEGFS